MRYLITLVLLSLVGILTGCNRYLVTFNEQPVYTPPVLFTAYKIGDDGLRNCVAQTIADQGHTHAKGLRGLNCSAAGITQLDGLDIFGSLETLILANNTVVHLTPLLSMPSLVNVDLSGNPSLNCAGVDGLTTLGTQVTLPQHCHK